MNSHIRIIGLLIVISPNLTWGAATISLRAVKKNGVAITPTNSVTVAPNDTIEAEVVFFGWSSPPFDGAAGLVKSYQATLDGAAGAVSNGADPTDLTRLVLPTFWNAPINRVTCPCTPPFECTAQFGPQYGCTLPGFNPATMASIATSRTDFILYGFPNFTSESEASLNIRWGGTIDGNDGQTSSRCSAPPASVGFSCTTAGDCGAGGVCNANFVSYAGTLNLKAGASVCGTTTYTFVANEGETFLAAPGFIVDSILPATIQGLTISVPTNPNCPAPNGACCNDATGICQDGVTDAACAARWGGAGSTCATIDPTCAPVGACCNDTTDVCQDGITQLACDADRWGGVGSTCATIEPACALAGCSSNANCDDGNMCTDDICSNQVCEHNNNTAGCTDGQPCTVGDQCTNGNCISGQPADCSEVGGPCEIASCDTVGAEGNCDVRTLVKNFSSCSDGQFCNGEEACVNGVCVMGEVPCRNGLGCHETEQTCLPCVESFDCYDYHACTTSECNFGTCAFDSSQCTGACCFLDELCFDGLTLAECAKFSGGVYLGHDISCSNDPDNDGASGCLDRCPYDPRKFTEGFCGCGALETDTDDDSIPDCKDCCEGTQPGVIVDGNGCVLVGACRSASGATCLNGLSEASCEAIDGTYLGNGTTCESTCLICPERGGPSPDSLNPSKVRFISFKPASSYVCESAFQVTMVSLHHANPPYAGGPSIPFTSFEGQVRWVGPPVQYLESFANGPAFYAAQLQCTPHYQDWSTVGLLHVTGSAIVPSSIYDVENVAASCMGVEANCTAVSAPLTVATARWADVETPYNPPSSTTQPDLADVSALVNKFRNAPGAPIKARALLVGGDIFGEIDIATEFSFIHISACVDAFRGRPYPHTIAACP